MLTPSCILILKHLVGSGKGAGLPGTAGRVVLGIKIGHYLFAPEIRKRDSVAVFIGQDKIRHLATSLQHIS